MTGTPGREGTTAVSKGPPTPFLIPPGVGVESHESRDRSGMTSSFVGVEGPPWGPTVRLHPRDPGRGCELGSVCGRRPTRDPGNGGCTTLGHVGPSRPPVPVMVEVPVTFEEGLTPDLRDYIG